MNSGSQDDLAADVSREGRKNTPEQDSAAAGDGGLERYLLQVSQGKPGLVPSLLRGGLGALAPVYCAGLKTYLLPYRLGLRRRTRLACPVICVGNLTTGGTGKTPMTQTLCRLLRAQGRRVVVLSRGYGGENEYGCAIASDGEQTLLTARQAGDEAYLLARTLPGVPVIVGKDRRVTGQLAQARFGPDVIVLDDGMQFWQLHRDLDIVLLNACAPFDNGWTFPRGLLREPPSHLHRAGIIILTNAARAGADAVEQVSGRVARLAPHAPVFTADLAAHSLRPVSQTFGPSLLQPGEQGEDDAATGVLSPDALRGRKVAALSALGNPASFEAMLTGLGYDVAQTFRFRDHRQLTDAELQTVLGAGAQAGAVIVTTEKDAVKLAGRTGDAPIYALRVRMQVEGQDAFFQAVGRLSHLA